MTIQIKKIVSASELQENRELVSSLFYYARIQGERQLYAEHYRNVKAEHDREGVYEIKLPSVPYAITRVYNFHKNKLQYLSHVVPSFKTPSVLDVCERKTGDGRKLYKALDNAMKRAEKMLDDDGTDTLTKQNIRYVLPELAEFKKTIEAYDQKHGLKIESKTVYARLSFRSQDVLGMTSLGDYSSCQDVTYRGFDEYATRAVASMLSDGIGTLTIHQTLESATMRDTATSYQQFDSEDKATARVNVLQDENGSLAHNDSFYGDSAELITVIDLMTDAGIFIDGEELGTVSVASFYAEYERTFSMSEWEAVEAELTGLSENQMKEACRTVLDDAGIEYDTSDDSDELKEIINNESLEYELLTELIDTVDELQGYTFERSYFTLYRNDDSDYEWEIDSEYVPLSESDVLDAVREELNEMDVTDAIEYIEHGYTMTCSVHVEYETTVDDESDEIEPYEEGLLECVRKTWKTH